VADVHAVVVGMKGAQIEPHAHHVRDATAVLDTPSLVVAGNCRPPSTIGVVLIHQSSCLLRERLTSRVPVLQREEPVEQFVQDPPNSLTSGSRMVTNDLSISTWRLALVQRDVGRKIYDLSRRAILKPALVENLAVERRSTYADGDFDIAVCGNRLRESCCAGNCGGCEDDCETHGDMNWRTRSDLER
jgi:hypothetical protein